MCCCQPRSYCTICNGFFLVGRGERRLKQFCVIVEISRPAARFLDPPHQIEIPRLCATTIKYSSFAQPIARHRQQAARRPPRLGAHFVCASTTTATPGWGAFVRVEILIDVVEVRSPSTTRPCKRHRALRMKTSRAQNTPKSGSTTTEAGPLSPPPSSPSSQETPRAIAVNSADSKASETDSQQDPILINVTTGERARWSATTAAKPGQTEHLVNPTGGQSGLPRINKQCLPRGGTYLSTIIGPIQVSRLVSPRAIVIAVSRTVVGVAFSVW